MTVHFVLLSLQEVLLKSMNSFIFQTSANFPGNQEPQVDYSNGEDEMPFINRVREDQSTLLLDFFNFSQQINLSFCFLSLDEFDDGDDEFSL